VRARLVWLRRCASRVQRGGLRSALFDSEAPETPVLSIGGIEIDNVRHRLTRAGAEVKLTPKEFELLSFLARHAGKVATHRQLLAAVWGPGHSQDTHYLLGHLRQKIEDSPNDPKIILTEPGIGYRIAEAV
jgi:two-component system KDP operon response regulator KdpE